MHLNKVYLSSIYLLRNISNVVTLCLLSPLFINKEQKLTVLFIEDQINLTIRFAVRDFETCL